MFNLHQPKKVCDLYTDHIWRLVKDSVVSRIWASAWAPVRAAVRSIRDLDEMDLQPVLENYV